MFRFSSLLNRSRGAIRTRRASLPASTDSEGGISKIMSVQPWGGGGLHTGEGLHSPTHPLVPEGDGGLSNHTPTYLAASDPARKTYQTSRPQEWGSCTPMLRVQLLQTSLSLAAPLSLLLHGSRNAS